MFEQPKYSYRAYLILLHFRLVDQTEGHLYAMPPDQERHETEEARKDITRLECSTCNLFSDCPHRNQVSRFPRFCGKDCLGKCARYAAETYGGVAWYAPTTGEMMHIPPEVLEHLERS